MTHIPPEIAMKILDNASTLSEYISIRNVFDIPDYMILEAVNEECREPLEHLSPIEKLFYVRQSKYIAIAITSDRDILFFLSGTKDMIIQELVQMSEDNDSNVREYYTSNWDDALEPKGIKIYDDISLNRRDATILYIHYHHT
jgi:hypothetical protein